jgi:hypothetical protein
MKKKMHIIKKKLIRAYAHKHPLIFFAIVFNIFVFFAIFMTNAIIDDFDRIIVQKIFFKKPDPVLQKELEEMLVGYPMATMAPYIASENKRVAAYLVAIGKKESAWGERSPKLDGKDCFNYWGFRRKSERMGSGGHTCFDSPEEAVRIVAWRIDRLIKKGYDTPAEMVIWKCGDCSGPEAVGASKWIRDVDLYYQKMMQ